MASNMRAKRAWGVLSAVLVVEVAAGAVLIATTLFTFPGAGDPFIALWVSLIVSLVLAWIWAGATLIGAFRSRASWVRASSVTIHVLMLAAAVGVLQGILGTVPVGIALALLAAVGIVAALGASPVEPEAQDL